MKDFSEVKIYVDEINKQLIDISLISENTEISDHIDGDIAQTHTRTDVSSTETYNHKSLNIEENPAISSSFLGFSNTPGELDAIPILKAVEKNLSV